jgi:hypothetical protein
VKRIALLLFALVALSGASEPPTITKMFTISQNADLSQAFDSSLNLTGCTLAMEIRATQGGTLYAAPLLPYTNAALGQFTATLTASQTSALNYTTPAYYDITATCAGPTVTRIFEGTATLSLGVTTGLVAPGSVPAGSTTGPLDLWADQTLGNDTNACTQTAPCATEAALRSKTPWLIAHPVTWHFKAGAYDEAHYYHPLIQTATAYLKVIGEDWTTPILGSGSITSGTFGTAAINTAKDTTSQDAARWLPVAGAAWVENELVGYFIEVTISGTVEHIPVSRNISNQISIDYLPARLNGLTFRIVDPAFRLLHTGDHGVVAGSQGKGRQAITAPTILMPDLIIEGARIEAAPGFRGIMSGLGGVVLKRSVVRAGQFGIYAFAPGGELEVNDVVVVGTSSTAYTLAFGLSSIRFINNNVFHAGQNGVFANAAQMMFVANGTAAAQYATVGDGWDIYAVTYSVSNTVNDLIAGRYNATAGFRFDGDAAIEFDRAEFHNNTGPGVIFGTQGHGEAGRTNWEQGFASANGGDGVRFEGAFNSLKFGDSGVKIQGNGGAGINMRARGSDSGNAYGSQNILVLQPNQVMGTNTAGDLSADGITFESLATFRARAGDALELHQWEPVHGGNRMVQRN